VLILEPPKYATCKVQCQGCAAEHFLSYSRAGPIPKGAQRLLAYGVEMRKACAWTARKKSKGLARDEAAASTARPPRSSIRSPPKALTGKRFSKRSRVKVGPRAAPKFLSVTLSSQEVAPVKS